MTYPASIQCWNLVCPAADAEYIAECKHAGVKPNPVRYSGARMVRHPERDTEDALYYECPSCGSLRRLRIPPPTRTTALGGMTLKQA
jgi:hypothetical protein